MRPASLGSENGRGLRGEDVVLVVIPASCVVLVVGRLALLQKVSGLHRGKYRNTHTLALGRFILREAG